MPGNVFLPAAVTGLPVVNVTAVVTLNKTGLTEQAGLAPLALLREVDRGLRNVLDLWWIKRPDSEPTSRVLACRNRAGKRDEHWGVRL